MIPSMLQLLKMRLLLHTRKLMDRENLESQSNASLGTLSFQVLPPRGHLTLL